MSELSLVKKGVGGAKVQIIDTTNIHWSATPYTITATGVTIKPTKVIAVPTATGSMEIYATDFSVCCYMDASNHYTCLVNGSAYFGTSTADTFAINGGTITLTFGTRPLYKAYRLILIED